MIDWGWLGPVLALVGVVIGAAGTIVGAILMYRVNVRANAIAAATARATRENALIDQLQEELSGYRKTADERAAEMDRRMNALEARNVEITQERDGYRDYAHELRAHIYDQNPPPPPEWPAHLPR